MPKRTSANSGEPLNVTLVTLDGHLAGSGDRAISQLVRDVPGLRISLHSAGEWGGSPQLIEECRADIADAHIIIVCMLFTEETIEPILADLEARREHCDAMLCFLSAGEVMKLTRIGGFSMNGKQSGPLALLKRLRGSKKREAGSSGARQLAVLRRLPRILRFLPGTAQDLRVYFLAMQYWLAGSEVNVRNLIAMMINRYADGPRRSYRGAVTVDAPREYPETGLYHPSIAGGIATSLEALPKTKDSTVGTVGVLVMRSDVLAANSSHYDAVIDNLERRGLRVIPAFASGLDARPAVERYLLEDGRGTVDAVVSLTGFSRGGGAAYNAASAAEAMLADLDVPYLAAHGTEFQSLEAWEASDSGMLPVETTLMVAIPELDGAIAPTLFAGRSEHATGIERRAMQPCAERVESLCARIDRLVALRRTPRAERKLGIVLFNFPPNGGSLGTAAHLSVFRSLFNTLRSLKGEGYEVELPADPDALRDSVLNGNSERFGTDANVHVEVSADDHVRRERWLEDIEKEWGPAPGRAQSNGSSILVLGRQFGNVFVGIQPAFGYEGDPMRLLFDRGLAPTLSLIHI